jgi:toxin ParE1/3/4
VAIVIIYSKLAQQDILSIYNYIRRGSIKYAHIEVELIRSFIRKLKENPLLGRRFERAVDENTRELSFRNYRIVYDMISENKILILTIHHHSRSLGNNRAFSDED